ncbi:MAG: hypothetical protein JSV33_09555 [bacterium]|nr:MAG: hypothetical protein JSV33_09555 [bacterium]
MKHLSHWILIVALLGAVFAGCSRQSEPISPVYPTGDYQPSLATGVDPDHESALINGYRVLFTGRTYADNQTEFRYLVCGECATEDLSTFFLELPDCAPELQSYCPEGADIGIYPDIQIYGIKWDLILGPINYREYCIAFPGDIPLGVISVAVKTSTVGTGEIAGPCAGDTYLISGTAYIDADGNGVKGATDESGIAGVTVTLDEGGECVQTTITDANGEYSFLKAPGTYTLSIEATTDAEDFNEELFGSFDPTGPTSIQVTVGPDSPGNDFGFYPRAEEIIEEIDTGEIITTGESAKFWRKQVHSAMRGKSPKGKVVYDPGTMAQFIAEIQELYLPEPFQFTPGNEFKEALAILKSRKKDPLQQLLRELLAAELNHVSGRGLVENPALQEALLAWAESVYIDEALGSEQISGSTNAPLLRLNGDRLEDAIGVLLRMNGNIGGGSGGGG